MPALNFNSEFADKVKSGEKTCTIRKERKRPIKEYDCLYFFTGQRTPKCQRIGTGICTKTSEIVINRSFRCVFLGEKKLDKHEILQLVIKDGFDTVDSFFDFFTSRKNPIFTGQYIYWEKQ